MSEMAKLLRLLVQADKEATITPITVTGDVVEFESRLSSNSGELRKAFAAYNNSDAASGDIFYSYTKDNMDLSGEAMVVPKGALLDIPVAPNLQIYFFTSSGEFGDLKVEELA